MQGAGCLLRSVLMRCCRTDVTIIVGEGSTHVSVTEGEAVRVCARMLGMADFPISASFQPRPVADSAVGGVDYVSSEHLLVFPALSQGFQCVEVQSLEDMVVETDEVFEVELVTASHPLNSKIALGGSSTVTVTILDNDCEFFVAYHVIIM